MSSEPQVMQCMEVWGGNHPVDSGVVMAGLDAWVYCRPYKSTSEAEVGGDVYYVSSCATGRITRLLVADVSGHGAQVGDVATNLRTLMRKYVNYLDPCRFVGEMNKQFSALSRNGSFATAVVTTFFSTTRCFTFCNAGHPPPLIYRAGKGWAYQTFGEEPAPGADDSPSDLPLGVEEQSAYSELSVRLNVGDLVICYTDGLPESRGADGEFLGQEGLLQIVNSLEVADPARIVPSLLKAIGSLREGNLAGDDVTVMLVRLNGVGSNSTFLKRLLSPFRVAWGLTASLLPGGGPAPWPDYHPANMGGAVIPMLGRFWKRDAH